MSPVEVETPVDIETGRRVGGSRNVVVGGDVHRDPNRPRERLRVIASAGSTRRSSTIWTNCSRPKDPPTAHRRQGFPPLRPSSPCDPLADDYESNTLEVDGCDDLRVLVHSGTLARTVASYVIATPLDVLVLSVETERFG